MTLYIDDALINTQPEQCIYTDYAGGQCDSLDIVINDKDNEIFNKRIKKGLTIEAISDTGADTGVMYISEIEYSGGIFFIHALSLPVACFKAKNQYWDTVNFFNLVTDIASETDLKIKLLNPINVTYIDVTRIEEPPIKFLSKRLELEGFSCKVYDGYLIVYNERIKEHSEYEITLGDDDFISTVEYSTSDAGLVNSVENLYNDIKTIVSSGIGGKALRENIAVSSIGESQRFSNGIMRAANKYEYISSGTISGNERRAGQVVYRTDALIGWDEENYIYKVKNDLVNESQVIFMRKPIKGEY